jgi:hypothetical protein
LCRQSAAAPTTCYRHSHSEVLRIDRRLPFQLFATLPYEPPLSASDPVPTNKRTLTFSSTQSSAVSAQNEYTVGLTLQASGGFLGLSDVVVVANGFTYHTATNAAVGW